MDKYIKLAILQAQKSNMTSQHGCVVVHQKTGKVLSVGHNYFTSKNTSVKKLMGASIKNNFKEHHRCLLCPNVNLKEIGNQNFQNNSQCFCNWLPRQQRLCQKCNPVCSCRNICTFQNSSSITE